MAALKTTMRRFGDKYHFKLIPKCDYTEDLFGELYELSTNLIKEDYEHWKAHAITNQFLHLIQDKTQDNKTLGFQFWRHQQTQSPRHSLLFGGKIRYHPCIRGLGLNLLSNVEIYHHLMNGYIDNGNKDHMIYRVGLMNIFGYLSVIDCLDKHQYFLYPFNDNQECQTLIKPLLNDFCIENQFETDLETGLVNVKQQIPEETILSLEASFWSKSIIQEYMNVNPKWNQGWDVFVAWQLNEYNIDCMSRKAWTKYNSRDCVNV